jgi:putative SOS response-associated peptidase YedK
VCGRAQYLKVPEIIEKFGPARIGNIVDAVLTEESFPRSVVPGLVLHKGERVVSSFAWGFFDDGTGHNARLETAADRPAWREAYASARLVLPLARFVEGRAWFSDASARPLAVAGLYRLGARPAPSADPGAAGGRLSLGLADPPAAGADPPGPTDRLGRPGAPPGGGGSVRRATMLTRPADDLVAPFHERMPVILPADLIGPWLAGEPVPIARLLTELPDLTVEPLTRPGPPPPEQPSLL